MRAYRQEHVSPEQSLRELRGLRELRVPLEHERNRPRRTLRGHRGDRGGSVITMRSAAVLLVLLGCTRDSRHESNETQRSVPVVAPMPAVAPKPVAVAPPLRSSLATKLASVDTFAVTGVGIAGTTSGGETLTLEIAKQPDAIATFEELLSHPNRVARLYAYWALRTLDPPRAATHANIFANDTTMVQTGAGCLIFHERTNEVASQMPSGRVMARP